MCYQLYRHLGRIFNFHWLIEFQARITKLYRLLAEQLCIIDYNNRQQFIYFLF